MTDSGSTVLPTVAELAEHLFECYPHPSGRKYSNREVETEIPGYIRYVNISKIRNGKIRSPSRESILIFCRFFTILPLYFFPELWTPAQRVAFWRCLADHDPQCPHVTLRQR